MNKGYNNIIEGNEISFYENICSDLEYINSNKKDKKNEKEQNESEKIEEKIRELLNKDIRTILNK